MRNRTTFFALLTIALACLSIPRCYGQAALLMEQPYGVYGELNPTGHNAVYFRNICADTPTHLRRCNADEDGTVIARYQGIAGYDWVAIPLIPYLYTVEDPSQVPDHVDRETVNRLRSLYHESHLLSLGPNVPEGTFFHGGWVQLIGVAYERSIYAFRFDTTQAEDDALIERLNSGPNHTHFELFYSNCADFARSILNSYFPHAFHRNLFPDAGMTTPKHLAWELERYGRKHPQVDLAIYEIPQIPGYRRKSISNKGVGESLTTTLYAIPIVILNPYLAGTLFLDYLAESRYKLLPSKPQVIEPADLSQLTAPASETQNPPSADIQAPLAAVDTTADTRSP